MTLKDEENNEMLQAYLIKNSNLINIGDRENPSYLNNESELLDSSEKNNLNHRNLLNKTNVNSAFSSKIMSIFNDIPYFTKIQNYTFQASDKNNKLSKSNNSNQLANSLSNSNYNFFQSDKKSDNLLHINSGTYGRILIFCDKQYT